MKLIVSFKGKLKAALKFLPGNYFRESNTEYEKFWHQGIGVNAIWYDSQLGRWIFGTHIPSTKTWLYSEDDVAGPQLVTNWKYRQGRQVESDDILIHRTVDSGKYVLYIMIKFVYSEKATKFCEISTVLLSTVHTDKSKVDTITRCNNYKVKIYAQCSQLNYRPIECIC